jgi:hypothetical protein
MRCSSILFPVIISLLWSLFGSGCHFHIEKHQYFPACVCHRAEFFSGNFLLCLGFGTQSRPYRHSNAINESPQLQLTTKRKVSRNYDSKTHVKPAKASIPKYVPTDERKGLSALRCHSKGSGSLRDPVVGICCHSCR